MSLARWLMWRSVKKGGGQCWTISRRAIVPSVAYSGEEQFGSSRCGVTRFVSMLHFADCFGTIHEIRARQISEASRPLQRTVRTAKPLVEAVLQM